MSYDELQVEIDRLREEVEASNLEKEKLIDEREELVNQYEEEFDRRKQELEDKSQKALDDLRASQENQIETLSSRLDQMTRAFSGDPCGWHEKKDRKSGKVIFVNDETGETEKEKPMILEFAEKVMNIDQGDADKNALHKATSKARDAETAKRKMEVTVNETRAEIMNLKSLLKNWTTASVEIFHEINSFDSAMNTVYDNVMNRLPDFQQYNNKVEQHKIKADHAAERIETKNDVISKQHFKITALNRKVDSLTKENTSLKEKVEQLEEQMEKEIEVLVAPLRLEVASAKADLMKEKAARTEDRIELADLWPPGWLMPSVLVKFKTLDIDQKAAKRQKALELDAERSLKEEIRAAVLEAGKWSEQYDEYGQMFYQHADTGESAWEQPPAMLYVPPPGRDEMGNKLLDAKPPSNDEEDDEAAEELANWVQETDQWGQSYFSNTETGETSWEAPEGFVVSASGAGAVNPKESATEAARVVISYLKNRKPEIDKDGEEEELVYDMQEIETLATGNDGWKYKKPGDELEDDGDEDPTLAEKAKSMTEKPDEPLSLVDLRELMYGEATTEADLEESLRKSRKRLSKLSHRLLEKKKVFDKEEEESRMQQKMREQAEAAAAALAEMQGGATDSEFELSDDESKPMPKKTQPKSDMEIIKDEMKEIARKEVEKKEAKEEAKQDEGDEKKDDAESAAPAESKEETPPTESPENEIPPPGSPKSTNKPSLLRSLDDKIDKLKQEHSDDEMDDEGEAEATIFSPELVEMLAERAAPQGKIKNETVQALAIQAVWAGMTNSDVKVPPLELIKDDDATKWGTAAFFATLDETLLSVPQTTNKSPAKDTSEAPLPALMNARERKRRFTMSNKEQKDAFMNQAWEAASLEAHNELQKATDRMFSKHVMGNSPTEVSYASSGNDDYVSSDITRQFKQQPKGMSMGKAGVCEQEADPLPGKIFPDPAGDKIRIAEQSEARSANMLKIKKRDKVEMETPWLLEGAVETKEKKKKEKMGDEEERSAGNAKVEDAKEEEAEDKDNDGANDAASYDSNQEEEKKSASPRSEVKSTNQSASIQSASIVSSSTAPLSPPPPNNIILVDPPMTIEQLDAVQLIREDAIIHNKALRPLLDEADKLRSAVWSDHFEITAMWQERIAEKEEEKKKLEKQIREANAFIDKTKKGLQGLAIENSKPKPPVAPQKVQLVSAPRNINVGDDTVEEDVPLLINGPGFQTVLMDIHKNVYNGKTVILPNGVKITEAQKSTLLKAIESKNENMKTEAESLAAGYEEKFAKYEESLKNFAGKEEERIAEYTKTKYQVRILILKADHLHELRELMDKEIERYQIEAAMEQERGVQLREAQGMSETVRAKQVMEHFRGPEIIGHLQDQLCMALEQRTRALELPSSATNVLQRVALEETRTKMLRRLRMTIAKIREQLIEEGRRRKFLYEEEFASAQKDVKMIREENNQAIERGNCLRVIDSLLKLDLDTREVLKDAKVAEATEDTEGVDVGGSYGEEYLPDKKWNHPAVNIAIHEVIDVQRCLGAALEARKLAREREARSRDQGNPGNATSLPPHADQWLPHSEKVRMMEEMEWVKYHAGLVIANNGGELKNEKFVVEHLKGAIEVLKNKLAASKRTHAEDVRVTRFTSERAFELLQERLNDHIRTSKAKEARYEEAITALNKEINETRTTLNSKIEEMGVELQTMESMSTVLRYELSEFHVREEVTRKELEKVKDMWRRDLDTLKVQLRSERNHTARLELWIAAMHDDVKYYLKEIKLRENRLTEQRKESEAAQLALKYERWMQTTAMYALGTDVDTLFLFFMQRIVNLAGSGKFYNDSLRANGAMAILTAAAKGPRKDIRRLAARALGSMGWNGYTEQRLLGWDVVRSWKLHMDDVIPKEEEKLRKIGKTFEDKVATEGENEVLEGDEEFVPSPSMSLRAIIRERRQWALRKARRREGPNEENQIMLGGERSVLRLLLDLCRVQEWDVVRYATMALSVAAYHESNNGIMGKTKHCIETVVGLCRNLDEEIQTQAAATLANLAYGNEKNQELIGSCGGVEVLLDLCRGADVDVIEASTAALANLVTLHSGNAVRLASCGGVDALSHLITSNQIVNLLDFDQISEIQANAAECLANVTRNYGKANAARIHDLGLAPIILMCGSHNLQVQRHAALVLGNISQDEDQREVIGLRGGVEALMLLCEKEDEAVRANSLWALGNLAWHPLNQERIGRFLNDVVNLCKSDFLPVRVNAICCLANSLYFHDKNRERLGEIEGAVELVISMCGEAFGEDIWENALRAVVSLTYADEVGYKLGKEGLIRTLVKRCYCTAGIVQKYAAMGLLNLSIHDALKIRILEEGGVEALAGMQNSESKEAREVALNVLEALADIRNVDELADQKAAFGIAGMLQLVQTDNDLIVKLACESLAEEVWSGGEKKQKELVELGGAEVIMKVLTKVGVGDDILNPALWTVRNLVHDNVENKSIIGGLGGVESLIKVIGATFEQKKIPIVESALTTLVNLVVDHEKNCRMLLKEGLDVLIDVAESYEKVPEEQMEGGGGLETYLEGVKNNAALATSLLQMIGPYNFLVCSNCGMKQASGGNCASCGRAISF
eukprot:CAMPEP_0118651064 /NCGR_PEP_ID=MMETSP0785-20121206/10589_1 /TAXON_ID=91992 /ORGANISM="Bolidomonas pacifica, Strain CCMP 1866" /LENGTH=2593 /DNA_ID=CAMNT_0006543497 /DNA_START=44 /DNA_END=7822 /DNA_ORIENTATION=+